MSGFPEALDSVYPQTRVPLCMVHLVPNSLRYVSYQHLKAVATDLKAIYSAGTETEAEFKLELFAEKWDAFYPTSSQSWRARLPTRDPFVRLPRGHSASVIYTTNAIESVNMTLRTVTRHQRIFPSVPRASIRAPRFRVKRCQRSPVPCGRVFAIRSLPAFRRVWA
jgi:putative transposase